MTQRAQVKYVQFLFLFIIRRVHLENLNSIEYNLKRDREHLNWISNINYSVMESKIEAFGIMRHKIAPVHWWKCKKVLNAMVYIFVVDILFALLNQKIKFWMAFGWVSTIHVYILVDSHARVCK